MAVRNRTDYWQIHLNAWQKSNISQNQYCKKNKINPSLFSKWKIKLSDFTDSGLVKLKFNNQRANENLGTIEIKINQKYSVIIYPDFNHQFFRQVISLLGELS